MGRLNPTTHQWEPGVKNADLTNLDAGPARGIRRKKCHVSGCMPLRFVVSEMSASVEMSLGRQERLVDELITERKGTWCRRGGGWQQGLSLEDRACKSLGSTSTKSGGSAPAQRPITTAPTDPIRLLPPVRPGMRSALSG